MISFAGQSRSISWTRDSEEQCSGQLIQMTSLPSVASPSGWSYFKLFSVKWNHFGMTMKGFAHILVYITQIVILSMLRYINCSLDLQGVHKIFFSLNFFDFTELCLFCRSAGCLVCVHTLTPRENRERPESGIF